MLTDHDLPAEEAAVALGAPPPPCMELLHLWRNREFWRAITTPSPPGFVRRRSVDDAPMPRPLARVRQLGVVRAWERSAARHPHSEDREQLFRFLRRKALAALLGAATAAHDRFGGGRISFAEVRLLDPASSDDAVIGRVDRAQTALVVSLAPDWLREVWARGLHELHGVFVLGVDDASAWPLAAQVSYVDWRPAGDSTAGEGDHGAHEAFVATGTVQLSEDGYRLGRVTP